MAGKKALSGVYVSWPRPDFTHAVKTHKHFRSNFHAAMMYAHYELTSSELKKETIKYLKSVNIKHPLIDKIKDMEENRFTTIGKYMYILNHGADIPDDIFQKLLPALEKVIVEEETRLAALIKCKSYEEESPQTKSTIIKPIISVQDRIRDKAREVAGGIEGWIDDFSIDKKLPVKTVDDFINLFKSNDLKAPHIKFIRDIFARNMAEISAAVEGNDKELVEAYSNYTKIELKKCELFNKNMLKACDMIQQTAKVERVPRKKTPVSAEKVVSKIKYKKEDSSLGIMSLNPTQIIGATIAWCFDTKTRKLTKYIADDVAVTLSVKGASIIGINQAKSTSKTLRKPADQLATFKKCNKVQLRTFMEEIATVGISPTGKLNENCIILKVQ